MPDFLIYLTALSILWPLWLIITVVVYVAHLLERRLEDEK